MPAATTHVEMAKDVLRTAPYLHEMIENKSMFFLGSQGPDMLFFSRASVLPGSLKKYGNQMHEEKVWEVISYFEGYAEEDADLKSYITGYLCHYALDSTAHPLVYAVSHALHKDGGPSEGEIHVGLESEIDIWTLAQRGRSIEDYNVYAYLKVNEECNLKLAEMYHNMLKDIFGYNISVNRIRQSIRDIAAYTKVLAPNEKKYQIFYNIEKVVFGGSHAMTAMMLNDTKVRESINLDHKSYTLPWAPYDTINASFPELYGKAVIKAQKLIEHHDKEDFKLNFCGAPEKAEC